MATKQRLLFSTFIDYAKLSSIYRQFNPLIAERSHRGKWAKVIKSMNQLSAEASANGLTDAKMDMLLADET